MAIDALQSLDVIEAMENFIARKRPPKHLREKLDIAYKIEDQSIFVYEIRPRFGKPDEKGEYPVAKTTFVKAKNHWKIFWMRANLNWHSYTAKPTVKTIKEFCELVEDDKQHCFWG